MTLVLLHPLPLDGSIWPDDLRALDDEVIAPTLYSLGASIEEWAASVVEMVGPGPLAVVGNSVGGSCAIEIARLVPDRVRLLVLVGAKAGHRPEPELRDAAVRLLRERGMAAAWPTYWAPLLGRWTPPEVAELARDVAVRQDLDDVIRGVSVFHGRPDRSAFLEQWSGPVRVVSGDEDRTPSNGAQLAASLVDGRFHVVEASGHYVPLEQPVELVSIVHGALAELS